MAESADVVESTRSVQLLDLDDCQSSELPEKSIVATDPQPSELAEQSNVEHGGAESAPASTSKLQKCHAIIFSQMKTEPANADDKFEDEEVREYTEYLDSCGFIIKLNESNNLEDIKKAMVEHLIGCDYFVVLMFRQSETDADLDNLVKSLKECNETAVKLLIFCRVCDPEIEEMADCLTQSLNESRKNLRNWVIIRCAASTRKLAAKFIGTVRELKRKSWPTQDLKSIIPAQIPDDIFNDIRVDINSYGINKGFLAPAMPEKLLKDIRYFCDIIGDGSRLTGLESKATEHLISSPDEISDFVYPNEARLPRQALIISIANFKHLGNSEQRPQSEMDVQNLQHVLTCLQYKVNVQRDLPAAKILEAVEHFAKTEDHGDSCILVLMSHGNAENICGSDFDGKNGEVPHSQLIQLMREGHKIKKKPRLVLFQACLKSSKAEIQQQKPGTTVNENPCAFDGPSIRRVATAVGDHYHGSPRIKAVALPPDQCGMIVGFSTSPKEFAFKGVKGSRFILAVCAAFYTYADREDMVSMITRINCIMIQGFAQPFWRGECLPMQLPIWHVQTHKKFFLVDTTSLFNFGGRQCSPPLESQKQIQSDSVRISTQAQ